MYRQHAGGIRHKGNAALRQVRRSTTVPEYVEYTNENHVMSSYEKFAVSGPDIVCEEFDGELVVLDLKTGCYFSFNRSASAIWGLLTAGFAPKAIEEAWGRSVGPLVESLVGHNLLVAVPEDGEPRLEPDMLATLQAAADAPAIEAFDDLADLIRADPVHDVDKSAGWPHQIAAVSF